jgi:phenylalanyl-tRNA synthetase beta chain
MRPSLLPNLLTATARNLARSLDQGGLFELGPRYHGAEPGQQATAVAAVRFGAAAPRHWAAAPRPVDALDAKALAQAALEAAGVPVEALATAPGAPAWFHPGRSGQLVLAGRPLAAFGELHPRLLEGFGIAAPVVGFELDLEPEPEAEPEPAAASGRAHGPLLPLPYPPVDRDFAFVVDADLPAEDLLRAVRLAGDRLIREVRLFDVYAGQGLAPGTKSLGVAVRLQSPERTLSEAEIEPVAERIVAAARALGAVLRS